MMICNLRFLISLLIALFLASKSMGQYITIGPITSIQEASLNENKLQSNSNYFGGVSVGIITFSHWYFEANYQLPLTGKQSFSKLEAGAIYHLLPYPAWMEGKKITPIISVHIGRELNASRYEKPQNYLQLGSGLKYNFYRFMELRLQLNYQITVQSSNKWGATLSLSKTLFPPKCRKIGFEKWDMLNSVNNNIPKKKRGKCVKRY